MSKWNQFAFVGLALTGVGTFVPNASADSVTFHFTPDAYHAAAVEAGIALHGGEDFEEANVPPNTGIGVNDPLDSNTNRAVFGSGDILAGLRLQSNTNGTPNVNDPGLDGLFPAGSSGLAALGVGANGALNKCMVPTAFGFSWNSLDVMATTNTIRGVGMHVVDLFPSGDGPMHLAVFDVGGAPLGTTVVEGDGVNGAFVGVVTTSPDCRVGRINIWAEGAFPSSGLGGDEGLYEAELHGVCPWDLDADGGVGFGDLLQVLTLWGTSPGGPPDFDGSGDVGFGDLLAVLSAWGPCG